METLPRKHKITKIGGKPKPAAPQPPDHDLKDYGGGQRANPIKTPGDLLLEETGISQSDFLNDQQAFKLYNEGLSVEQFLNTPFGKKLLKYADDDIQLFADMASSADLDDPNVVKAHRRARCAAYIREYLNVTLGSAIQAEQQLKLNDDAQLDQE